MIFKLTALNIFELLHGHRHATVYPKIIYQGGNHDGLYSKIAKHCIPIGEIIR